MARGIQGAVLRGFGARDHIATVVESVRTAPHLVRIRMTSPTLFEDADAEPAAWLRFWFPDPDGSNTEFQRAYTITEADSSTGRFAIDVVLHEPAGPACRWASDVRARQHDRGHVADGFVLALRRTRRTAGRLPVDR